ncbi:MAG: type II secretory pathway pseudopilin PulG, partial [Pirellulaceae bacterium]
VASKRPLRRIRKAFSLVEAIMALAMLAFAGSILLMVSSTAIDTADDSLEQLLARGFAERMVDEVLSFPYMENPSGGNQTMPGPEAGEFVTLNLGLYWGSRVGFDDTGDFNKYVSYPLSNRYGVELGKDIHNGPGTRVASGQVKNELFNTWYGLVYVKYADSSNLSQDLTSGTSDYRSVTVHIMDSKAEPDREIYRVRRVYSFLGQ